MFGNRPHLSTSFARLVAVVALFLTSAAWASVPGASSAPGRLDSMVIDGRTIEVYVPARCGPKAPLVLALHWSTARGKNMLDLWKATADREGAILVLPSSKNRREWTKGDGAAIDRALVKVLSTHRIDRDRIYVTGFSGGANMAWRLFLSRPGFFAGIGPFAGRLVDKPGELERIGADLPRGRGPQRACLVHGTSDRKIPFSESRRAVRELGRRGIDAELRALPQGHWPHPDYATPMWDCLDGHRETPET